jgi:MFS family permease
MAKKILITLATIVLFMLPFLIAIPLGKYSPYQEGNSFPLYVIISAVVSIAAASIVLLTFKYLHQSFDKITAAGALLFLLLYPLVSIFGLASGPDLSLKMLEHPEREHLRYGLLFIALIIFGAFILFLFRSGSLNIKKSTQWIITGILVFAFTEFIWEFAHHYSYPEGLKEWVNQGKNVDEFKTNYDNTTMIKFAVLGRYLQFISVIWLSLHLYKLRQIKIWNPIINTIFSLMGIFTATYVFFNGFTLPKGFEFLMLFFIPGIPFFLLYWLGVALITNLSKSEISR